jgi:hypothetical protein
MVPKLGPARKLALLTASLFVAAPLAAMLANADDVSFVLTVDSPFSQFEPGATGTLDVTLTATSDGSDWNGCDSQPAPVDATVTLDVTPAGAVSFSTNPLVFADCSTQTVTITINSGYAGSASIGATATDNRASNPQFSSIYTDTPVALTIITECTDGADNDANGLTDYPADLGCTDATDNDESGYTPPPAVTQCSDGLDNDVNGLTDFPDDPGCADAADDDESGFLAAPPAECADGDDNDGDGLTDYPSDPGCADASDDDENEAPTVTITPHGATVEGNTLGGANVAFSASASDPEDGDISGDVTCDATTGDFFALGTGYAITCTVTDSLGASGSDEWDFDVVDTTGPVVVMTSPVGGIAYYQSIVPAPACTAVDVVFGDVSSTCTYTGAGNALGVHDAYATANDPIPNYADSAHVAYCVTDQLTASGFYAPFTDTHYVKVGSTIPIKWRLTAEASGACAGYTPDPTSVGTAGAVTGYSLTCNGKPAGGTTAPRFDTVQQQWVINWQVAKSFAGQTCTVTVSLADGGSIVDTFQVKK